MAGIEELQRQADGLLLAEESGDEKTAKVAEIDAALRFSPFIPSQLARSLDVT